MSSRWLPPQALEGWLEEVAAEFGFDAAEVSIELLLNVAAEVAHQVARPAAPLSTFLLGLALGREGEGGQSLEQLSTRLSALASQWEEPVDDGDHRR